MIRESEVSQPMGEDDRRIKRQPSRDMSNNGLLEEEVVRAIKEARNRLSITQNELARRTGIDQGDISKLEHGTRNPSLKLLKRLADGLDMDLIIRFVPRQEEKNEGSEKLDD